MKLKLWVKICLIIIFILFILLINNYYNNEYNKCIKNNSYNCIELLN